MLTPTELKVYKVIQAHYAETEELLKPAEINAALGYGPNSSASCYVTSLVKKGLVERVGTYSHNYRVVLTDLSLGDLEPPPEKAMGDPLRPPGRLTREKKLQWFRDILEVNENRW